MSDTTTSESRTLSQEMICHVDNRIGDVRIHQGDSE